MNVGVRDGVGVGVAEGGGVALGVHVSTNVARAAVSVDAAAAVWATIVSTTPGPDAGMGADGAMSEVRSQLINSKAISKR